jgi:hypothetical protein
MALITSYHHNLFNSILCQCIQRSLKNRLAANVKKTFGLFIGEGSEAATGTGSNDDGLYDITSTYRLFNL